MTTAKWITSASLVSLVLVSGVSCGSTSGFGSNRDGLDGGADGHAEHDGSSPSSGGGSNDDGGTGGGDGSGGTSGGDASDDGSAGADASTSGTGGAVAVDGGDCNDPTTYYADTDDDGFGDPTSTIEACARPEGYAENSDDCFDDNAEAKPGQSGWFAEDRGDGSFDYDCDGVGVQQWPEAGNCGFAICMLTAGWQGEVPACGAEGNFIASCSVPIAICVTATEPRAQACH